MKIENWNGVAIRFVEKEPGEWWAVAADVTAALGIKNTAEAVNGNPKKNARGLPDSEKGIEKLYTLGGEQNTLIISEKGIYKLVFRSNKPEAENFQDWVFDIIKHLREAAGLEGFEAFRMLDKEHQREAMKRLRDNLQKPVRVDYIKANTIADKAVSTLYGAKKMVKKPQMPPEWLPERQRILDDTVDLMTANERFGLGLSVSGHIYQIHNKRGEKLR
jgi:prophage antirepressor-like protein